MNWFIVIAGIVFVYYLLPLLCTFISNLCRVVKKVFSPRRTIDSLEIMVIENEEQCRDACMHLKLQCKDFSALGFDCEWVMGKDGSQKPVSLLQLASVNGLCCLFRLNKMFQIPYELQEILRDKNILKLGVDAKKDADLLYSDYGAQVRGTLDLRELYSTNRSLAYLAKTEIDVTLDKSRHLTCSNWEAHKLSADQKIYAAKDAYVSVELFKKWLKTENEKLGLNTDTLTGPLKNYISDFIDHRFKMVNIIHSSGNLDNKVMKGIKPEGLIHQNLTKVKSRFVTRKVPLYDNCFMLAPDGELLCSCDKKKAQWYIDKGLAEVLPGEPYSIRLLFEPAARAGETTGGRYYQQLKQNCCVVCGASESYLRHNVVPKEYRKHFPKSMKDHQSHDIVLMCLKCHFQASSYNDALKQKLAEECEAPIKTEPTINREVQKIKNCATALLNSGDVIPEARKIELENKLKEYHGVNEVTEDLLHETVNLDPKVKKDDFTHGPKVVKFFQQKKGGLEKLQTLWRAHFLKTMNPQYLPALWSVNHNSTMVRMIEKGQSSENEINSL